MATPKLIDLPDGTRIPILYEDRSILAIDKPAGWMLAPDSWDRTSRNLQLALMSSIRGGDYWARSRNLQFIRFVHRLDADTTGVLLLVKSPRAVQAYSRLFESRRVEKTYLGVVRGIPRQTDWVCRLKLAPDRKDIGRIRVDSRHGQEAETRFHVLQSNEDTTLIEARPLSGRTHQIRVHLAESGHPVVGDALYGGISADTRPRHRESPLFPLGLRAVALCYPDPFLNRTVHVAAPADDFCLRFGFALPSRETR